MPTNQRTGTIVAIDRVGGGVKIEVRVPGGRSQLVGREYSYIGPRHPFAFSERIYGSDDVFVERLKGDGFEVKRCVLA